MKLTEQALKALDRAAQKAEEAGHWVTTSQGNRLFIGEDGDARTGPGGEVIATVEEQNVTDSMRKDRGRSASDAKSIEDRLTKGVKFSRDEADNLELYTMESDEVNNNLRTPGYKMEEEPDKILMKACSRKLAVPTAVYRGVGGDIADRILEGGEFEAQGFVSTSLDPGIASQFASEAKGGTVLEIQAKTGVAVRDVSLHIREREVLQAHGTRYKVKGVSEHDFGKGKTRVITMEEI